MGTTSSNTKRYSNRINSNVYSTPPKVNNNAVHCRLVQLQCDPRSPTDGISRTPIQIDSQIQDVSFKFYNHVMPHIVGPEILISEIDDDNNHNNKENKIRHRIDKLNPNENDSKRSSGIEPTLDPSKVLTALVATNDGQLPPYQL